MATNVEYKIAGNKLTITCNIDPKTIAGAEPSKSGKTNLVASTHGSMAVDGKPGLTFSLNLMQKAG